MNCPWCDNPVGPGESYPVEAYGPAATAFHRECWVREVCGSVGHQLGLCPCAAPADAVDDPPGYTRQEAAAAAARLAYLLATLPEARRPAAKAGLVAMIGVHGPDVVFAWVPEPAVN